MLENKEKEESFWSEVFEEIIDVILDLITDNM